MLFEYIYVVIPTTKIKMEHEGALVQKVSKYFEILKFDALLP